MKSIISNVGVFLFRPLLGALYSLHAPGVNIVAAILTCLLICFSMVGCNLVSPGNSPLVCPCNDCGGQIHEVLDNWNTLDVGSNGASPSFTLSRPACLREITSYHWNNGKGSLPGSIGLRDATGRIYYGPWPATGSPGQNGVPNVNWRAVPANRIVLPPGTYTVVDSDPASWSQNAMSNGLGFTKITVQEQ
jgi:hypothetical protein